MVVRWREQDKSDFLDILVNPQSDKIDSEQLKLFACKKTESENEWSESDELPDLPDAISSESEWKKLNEDRNIIEFL